MKKLFLIDAYALIFRFYYAFIGRPMRNNEGINTSAIYGFAKYIHDIVRREKPDYIGVAFDHKGGSFRNEMYPEYKANRESTPEDIITAVPYIKQILEAFHIPILEIPGYEADDIIGTFSVKASDENFQVFMVTPDKDFGQLVRPNVFIYKQGKGGEGVEIVDPAKIKERYGFDDPCMVADMLALWGDASDNIPGIPGIGEKSAVKLVCQFGTVENILAHVDQIKGKSGQNIAAMADQLRMSKELATIYTEVPVDFEPEKLIMEQPDFDALTGIYRELGFNSLLREIDRARIGETDPRGSGTATSQAASGGVPDLFTSSGVRVEASSANLTPTDEGHQTVDTVEHEYVIVTDPAEALALAGKLREAGTFAFDTETCGFDVFNDRLVGLSFSVRAHEAFYVPMPENREKAVETLAVFKTVFEDPALAKIAHNAKFDIMVLANYGISVNGFLYDTLIIHYLLDPESRHGMDFLAKRYLNYSPIPIEALIGKGAKQITMGMVPVDVCARYSAEDSDVTLRLQQILWPKLQEQGLEPLYRNIEEPLIRVLAAIELEGVRIDAVGLKEYGKELSAELSGLESAIREMVGDPSLNINSAKQLGEALFGRMNIDPNVKMTKTKQYRTDEEYLQSISDRHPVIGLILRYRGLRKLLSTYIDALPKLINPRTGKIHTSFNQAVTATGRLSSNNPNLQNIPIREEQGRQLRRSFIPSEEGCVIVSADYSQVELRLMAHLSEDPAMIADFLAGKDIHTATAARVFGISEEEVTRDQRRQAKTANFGIIYGISAFGLSQRLQIPRSDAKAIIEGYFSSYPGVREYIDRSLAQAREDGYVSTLFGRKRFLPDIKSSNGTVRGLAERNAINAPIQGSAADIIKIAMIDIHRRLLEGGYKSRITLQVHDELVLNVYRDELEAVEKMLIENMEGAAALKVPLLVECSDGANWLEAH